MIFKNDELLKEHRGAFDCEGCGKFRRDCAAHHAFRKRGLGGATRLDVSIQLIRLGWWCCHAKAEVDRKFNDELRAKIAAREKASVMAIEDALRFLLMCPKKSSPAWISTAAQGLSAEVRRLVMKCLEEMEAHKG